MAEVVAIHHMDCRGSCCMVRRVDLDIVGVEDNKVHFEVEVIEEVCSGLPRLELERGRFLLV